MSYAPPAPAGKRQKVRDGRASDAVDYFQGIETVETSRSAAPAPAEGPLTYRHYGAGERVLARALDDWLKCSLSLTDFRNNGGGFDQFRVRPWEDGTTSLENHKRSLKALFELCSKLGVRYWTALDTDLAPGGGDGAGEPWDEVVEYIQELAARWHVKLLWLAPDLTSHPRYASGALTNSDASVVAQAGAQIKRSLEAAQRLGAECFMLWPGREGFDFFHCDVAREIKLFSKLLKITAEYKERLNYRCQLLITPYNCQYQLGSWSTWPTWNGQGWRDERVNCYMWDVTSCLYFLKHYNLDRYYKVCTPPGHHMYMANVYNMLGGVTISEQFDVSDGRTLTLMMKCIVDQGAPPAGGINVRVRSAGEPRELAAALVRRLDALARALRLAARLAGDQALGKHVQQRYASYQSGLGARLAAGDVALDDCDDHHKKAPAHSEPANNRVEHYELVFQRYLDTCDHI